MPVRAKFKVNSITKSEGNGASKTFDSIKLFPVYGDGNPESENSKFWQFSPSGLIELNTINPDASAQFEVGKEYYIDFTPAN